MTGIPTRNSRRAALLLGLIVALGMALRARGLGHLLIWDEALNVCSVRAFAVGGTDPYSTGFWRHPPLFSMLMLLLAPLRPGFAERAELLAVLFSAGNVILLFRLTSRVFGTVAALWAAFFLAVMPGAILFDVWIKRDAAAVFFSLLALHLFLARRDLTAGLAMGLALLSKETAAFFAPALFGLWAVGARPPRRLRQIIAIGLIAAATAGWWYPLFSSSVRYYVAFVQGADSPAVAVWVYPWHYYFWRLRDDLGPAALLLCLCGLLAAVRWRGNGAAPPGRAALNPSRAALLPLLMFAPAFAVLTLARGKASWFVLVLLPSLAMLAGVGAAALARRAGALADRARATTRHVLRPALLRGLAAVVAAVAVARVAGRDYEDVLRRTDFRQWAGAAASRRAACALNSVALPGERALVTPFHYWQGSSIPDYPDPVFAFYLANIPVVVSPNSAPFEQLVDEIREHRLDWALLSPPPADGVPVVIRRFMHEYGLRPWSMKGACLFRTKTVYEQGEGAGGEGG
ncbi:MAG: glycosyltransferase family 39 protein [Kiritimatiellae bacterium]|nr:glycosyltransferase family 39 protein [Kiritimatiellia bacterium]